MGINIKINANVDNLTISDLFHLLHLNCHNCDVVFNGSKYIVDSNYDAVSINYMVLQVK